MAMEDAPINMLKPTQEDFIYRKNDADDIIYRPDYKPAEQLSLGINVTGLKGVTDFESFDQRNQVKKKERMEQTRMQNTDFIDSATAQGLDDIPEGEEGPDANMSRMSDVFDTIAPALGVQRQQDEH